jgi:hypothetical protein
MNATGVLAKYTVKNLGTGKFGTVHLEFVLSENHMFDDLGIAMEDNIEKATLKDVPFLTERSQQVLDFEKYRGKEAA